MPNEKDLEARVTALEKVVYELSELIHNSDTVMEENCEHRFSVIHDNESNDIGVECEICGKEIMHKHID